MKKELCRPMKWKYAEPKPHPAEYKGHCLNCGCREWKHIPEWNKLRCKGCTRLRQLD